MSDVFYIDEKAQLLRQIKELEAEIERLRDTTITIGTADAALEALKTLRDKGHYDNLMQDDKSFVAYAIKQLADIVDRHFAELDRTAKERVR